MKNRLKNLDSYDRHHCKLYINLFIAAIISGFSISICYLPFINPSAIFVLFYLMPATFSCIALFLFKTKIPYRSIGFGFYFIALPSTVLSIYILPFGHIYGTVYCIAMMVIFISLIGNKYGAITGVLMAISILVVAHYELYPVDINENNIQHFTLLHIAFFLPVAGILLIYEVLKNNLTQKLNDAMQLSLKERGLLLKEIHHRVKNNLQVITGLLSLQSSHHKNTDLQPAFKSMQYRINTMGLIHQMLYQSEELSKIDYGQYINKLVFELVSSMAGADNNIKLNITHPVFHLNVNTAIPLGLIINEIITNSLKYGIKDNPNPEISVKISPQEHSKYIIEIGDNGPGFPEDVSLEKTQTLGLKLIQNLTLQLNGSIEKDASKKGTNYIIYFEEIAQKHQI